MVYGGRDFRLRLIAKDFPMPFVDTDSVLSPAALKLGL